MYFFSRNEKESASINKMFVIGNVFLILSPIQSRRFLAEDIKQLGS